MFTNELQTVISKRLDNDLSSAISDYMSIPDEEGFFHNVYIPEFRKHPEYASERLAAQKNGAIKLRELQEEERAESLKALLLQCGLSTGLNPLRIPYGVTPQAWHQMIVESFSKSFHVTWQERALFAKLSYKMYEETGVFDALKEHDWKDRVPELSKHYTLDKFVRYVSLTRESFLDAFHPQRYCEAEKEAYANLLLRLSFIEMLEPFHDIFCSTDGVSADKLSNKDARAIKNMQGLDENFRSFLIKAIKGAKNLQKGSQLC